jgi:hypothetical protein
VGEGEGDCLGSWQVAPISPSMATISLGPFITPTGNSGIKARKFQDTGHCIEFGGDVVAGYLPLFLKLDRWQAETVEFRDYYVALEDLPFEVDCLNMDIAGFPPSQFVRLECVLVTLYAQNDVRLSLQRFLEDFANCLQLNHGFQGRMVNGARMMKAHLADVGFEVLSVSCNGRSLNVNFGWVLPQDRHRPDEGRCFVAGWAEFRPGPNRMLNDGRWVAPGKTMLLSVLYPGFKKLAGKTPIEALSAIGQVAALERFKWTKVSLLSAKELRMARVEFVRSHPQLHQDLKTMAKAMQQDGLYTDIADLHAIVRQLPKLIVEAGDDHQRSCGINTQR